ncbi:MAG: oligosaccharide flippase family protein, partial [Actinomycetota bacterium]|nr:oligosaccharide flippase family protein [Actinomycetota bacterium]
TIASVAAIGVVLFADSGPVVLMALGAVVVGITGLVNLTALFRAKPAGRLFGVPRLAVAKEIVAGGVPVFAVSVAQFLNKEQIDRLVIAVFIGPAAVVVYEVAAKLSMLITQVAGLPTSALLPVVSGMVARKDAAGVRDLFLDGGRYVTLLVAPVVITLAVLAGPFIGVWFGGEMQSSTPIAHLLILTQLFFAPLLVGDPILTGSGRIKLWVRWAGVVALTNLGLSIILVRSMGPTGVALATLVASLVELPLFARIILRELDIPVREWFGSVWRAYALLPLPALLAVGLARTALGSSLLGLLVCVGASLLAYWCVAWWGALAAEERATVLSRVRRPS